MKTYVILLRGINVGGKNKVPMAELKVHLEELGLENVLTYIQSGNVIVRAKQSAIAVSKLIEEMLPRKFKLDSVIVKAVALDHAAYQKVVEQAPKGFGSKPEKYRYNVMFLMGISVAEAMKQISTREGVDEVWPGEQVIYFSNIMAEASKSHLSKLVQKPMYASITIRNWNTTTKLLKLLEERTSV